MIERTLAKRYARALMAIAVEKNELDGYLADIAILRDVLTADPRAIEMLVSPLLSLDERKALFEKLVGMIEVRPDVANMAAMLVERGRIDLIGHVAEELERFADERLGNVRACVTSAVPLEGPAIDKISTLLKQRLKSDVILTNEVDPSLLGGAVLRIGNRVFDGSARGRLLQMIEALG